MREKRHLEVEHPCKARMENGAIIMIDRERMCEFYLGNGLRLKN